VSLAILGGGAIGVELGQAFARLGCRVHIIEAGPTFLGLEEPEAGAALRPHLEADGIMLTIGDPCVGVEQPMMGPSHERSSVVIHLKSGATVRADRLLVATGRRPNVLAIKLATPLKPLADVIHPFPAFNRMLGQTLGELAAQVVIKGEHHEQYASQH
jgi:pyruvate/2-oxoglutarate dehydrogenase complex dihydrolipoamide dehydrogenase (E3) component